MRAIPYTHLNILNHLQKMQPEETARQPSVIIHIEMYCYPRETFFTETGTSSSKTEHSEGIDVLFFNIPLYVYIFMFSCHNLVQ